MGSATLYAPHTGEISCNTSLPAFMNGATWPYSLLVQKEVVMHHLVFK